MTANPVQPIASLPSYILSHLDPASEQDSKKQELSRCGEDCSAPTERPRQESPFLRLPPELIDEVASHLDSESVFALRKSCLWLASSITLNQHFWFKAFISGHLFGFLFAFETVDAVKEIHDKAVKRHKTPPQWDWVKLIQQLANYSTFANDGAFHDAPPGFRNRRRIWKILDTIEQRAETRKESGGARNLVLTT